MKKQTQMEFINVTNQEVKGGLNLTDSSSSPGRCGAKVGGRGVSSGRTGCVQTDLMSPVPLSALRVSDRPPASVCLSPADRENSLTCATWSQRTIAKIPALISDSASLCSGDFSWAPSLFEMMLHKISASVSNFSPFRGL